MASSSAGTTPPSAQAEASSSQNAPNPDEVLDESDNDDQVANFSRDQAVLSNDPLDDDADNFISFKRKQKQPALSALPKAFPAFFSLGQASQTTTPRPGTPRINGSQAQGSNPVHADGDGYSLNTNLNHSKDGNPLDWYVEGPGRRVGYEDMTAIDWIFEYTKERQRLRVLYSSATGILGYAQRMLDASQIWIVLVVSGLAVGLIAAGIDVASDWLGDIKTGYCSAGIDSGRFYLNKYFCCWGYDEWSQCKDWVPWSTALHITSTGGKWFMEYVFFIAYSVSHPVRACLLVIHHVLNLSWADHICRMCKCTSKGFCNLCQA